MRNSTFAWASLARAITLLATGEARFVATGHLDPVGLA
jgi:hypothetical protein